MPCLEISLPKIQDKTKKELATKLTASFASITGHDGSLFGVLFKEYKEDQDIPRALRKRVLLPTSKRLIEKFKKLRSCLILRINCLNL